MRALRIIIYKDRITRRSIWAIPRHMDFFMKNSNSHLVAKNMFSCQFNIQGTLYKKRLAKILILKRMVASEKLDVFDLNIVILIHILRSYIKIVKLNISLIILCFPSQKCFYINSMQHIFHWMFINFEKYNFEFLENFCALRYIFYEKVL